MFGGFRARDGWFVVQAVREHQIARFAETVGHPEWLDEPRFSTRRSWNENLETVVRPAVEEWAASMSKHEAAATLAGAGVASGPSNHPEDLVVDPHLRDHHMLVEMPRPDSDRPVLTAGNPVKIAGVDERESGRWPRLGEHTAGVLRDELGLDDDALDALSDRGVITRYPPRAAE